MLSPDVPEFVPRKFQNLDSSRGEGLVENTISSNTPDSYSQFHRYSSNQGECNSGSWRREQVHSLSVKENEESLNNSYSFSNSNWRNSGSDDRNPQYSGKLREEASLKKRQTWREKDRQQSIVRCDNYEFSGKNKNWRDKDKQVQSIGRGQGLEQHAVNAPFTKRNATFLKVSGSATQNIPPECNASQFNKHRHVPDETDPQLKQLDSISKTSRGNRGSQMGGLVFSTQFRHQDDVSYKKVLSRKNFSEESLERADTIKNDALLYSQEQWPSLSITHSQNSSDNTVNVWIKNNEQEPASWSRPGCTDVTSSSGSLQKVISEGTHNDNAYPNSNIVAGKEGSYNHVNNGKDFYKKNKKSYQSYDETSKEKALNAMAVTKVYNSKKTEGNAVSDSKMKSESSTYSKEKDVSSKGNLSGRSTNVSLNQNTSASTSELKTEVMCSPSMEEESSEWQVQKKKKNKVKEHLEIAMKDTDRISSSNKEAKVNKRDYSHNKYPKISKHQHDITKKTNLWTGDKTQRFHSKGDKVATHVNEKEKVRDTVHEYSEKRIDAYVKAKDYEGMPHPSHKSTKGKGGNDVKDINYIDSKPKVSASLQNKNKSENNDSNFQRSLASWVSKDPPVKDERAKKASEEKKAKIKEEKMRKREIKIKAAQAQLASDSKVTMVSKEILEMMYRGQHQHSGKIAGNVSRRKVINTEPVHRRGETYQYSFENYPSLKEDRTIQVTEDVESLVNNKGRVSISLGEGYSDWIVKGNKDVKFQNSLTGRKNSDAASSFSSDDSKSKQTNTFNIHDAEGASDISVQESVSSYSKALLTAANKKIAKKKPTYEASIPKITLQKKKVKTKDEMTFNLLDAVAKKVKKKDLFSSKNQTKVNNQVEFDPVTMAIKERIQNRSRILFAALDRQTKRNDVRERNQNKGNSFLAALDSKSPKPRTEVVAKRGKQREGQKKKKLSALKKAIKRARQQEVENLLYVLQEAKKLQEKSIPGDIPVIPTSPFETLETVSLNGTPEIFTRDREMELSTEAVDNGDLKVVPSSDIPEMSDNVGESNCELKENKQSDTKVSSSNESGPDYDRHENMANKIHIKEGPKNIIDPDFSLKCQKILKDMEYLDNSVHKRSFREYCNHIITPEVNVAAKELISILVTFQDRQYKRDPVKARMRRRFVCGLRSTVKSMGKLSCIIVAPDIERCKGPGALDEVVENMLKHAESHCVPVIFALTCKKIGKLCLKKVGVSCIGIINYHGAQVVFQKLMELIPEAKAQYRERVSRGFCTVPVGDEPSDDESVPVQESVKGVKASNINEESTKGSSVAGQQSIREEIIASTVAILNEPSSEELVSTEEKSSEGSLTADADIASTPTVPNKPID